MTTPTCADCRFWKATPRFSGDVRYCMRRAPVRVNDTTTGKHPLTDDDAWCGEHEPVTPEAPAKAWPPFTTEVPIVGYSGPFAMLCDGCGADVSEDFKANRVCSACSNDTYVVKSPRMPLERRKAAETPKRPTDDGRVCGSVHDFGQASGERCLLDPGHTGNHYHSPSGWVWKNKDGSEPEPRPDWNTQ